MQTEYEKVLTIRNKDNKLMGFWCHDMKSHTVELYLCEKASLDEIKELVEQLQLHTKICHVAGEELKKHDVVHVNDVDGTVHKVPFKILKEEDKKGLKKEDLLEFSFISKKKK